MNAPGPANCGQGAGRDDYALGLFRTEEHERKALAERIHEDPLQTLSHIRRLLSHATEASVDPDELADIVREASRLTAAVGDHLQDIAKDLRPAVLDDFGLLAALRVLASDLSLHGSANVRFAVQGEEARPDPDIEVGCYRIAQDALRNVEQHAQAANVDLRLILRPNSVRLVVADDGVGFPKHTGAAIPYGRGLLAMRQRALALGGSLRIRSARPSGTVVRLCLPRIPGPANL
ncbi:MAG: hypothetical protein M0027_07615 [Candidatus Dormibacteraeota bacterium]|nr:hypothetical protein [Candidatus Dormibacteraeota bacterium]